MAAFTTIALAAGAAASIGGTVAGAVSAGKAERRARTDKNRLTGELEELEKSRQEEQSKFKSELDKKAEAVKKLEVQNSQNVQEKSEQKQENELLLQQHHQRDHSE